MNMIKLECPNCHAALDLDLEHLQAYCPYCGSKLLIDINQLNKIVEEKEKTKRLEIENTTYLKKLKIESIFSFLQNDTIILFILFIIWIIIVFFK